MGRLRRILLWLCAVALVPLAQVVSTEGAPPVHAASSSAPFVVDPAVNNTVATFATTDSTGGSEPSIAIDPHNVQQAVMFSFSGAWGATTNAPLWFTNNGGQTWTQESTVTPPPNRPLSGPPFCPCDQTVDYNRAGTLFGTFLIQAANPQNGKFNVVSGDTTDPTNAASWQWNGATAQLTNNAHSGNSDQPWLLVNRDPTTAANDNTYVAYDEFNANNSQVAASLNAAPPNFTVDNSPGSRVPIDGANPGLRLAKDPRNGWMYALWQTATSGGTMCSPFNTGTTACTGGTQGDLKNVTLHLSRSKDAGSTWALNGTGASLNTGNQDEYDWSFGGVNTLQGGIDHVAVDPSNGDVYIVYGLDTDGATATNYNSIFIARLTYDNADNLNLAPGYPVRVNASTNAALPSVAVTSDGTVGVLFDTFDGNNTSGIPTFSAHLSRSTDHGGHWSDTTLKSFATTAAGTTPPTQGQRDFGDFQQLKTNLNDFYGTFTGNRQAFSSTASNVDDPIFFTTAAPNADLEITKSGAPDPVTPGGNLTYTIPVTNHGPYDALSVAMNDALPVGTTFVSLPTPAGWTCSTPPVASFGSVSCTIPTLASGATATFTLTVHVNPTVSSGTVLSNTANVSSTTPDPGVFANSATATTTVNCANNITGSVSGNLTASGGSWCINNANVGGSLNVTAGTTAVITNSTLHGVTGTSPASMSLCNDRINGAVTITDATKLVVVGDPTDDACSGNSIGGNVTLTGNTGGVELSYNNPIGGQVIFNNNVGVNFFDDQVPEVAANAINGSLSCTGNSPAPGVENGGDSNVVHGTRSGQCSTL